MTFARRDVLALLVAVAIPLAVGAVGGAVTAPAIEGWYDGLARPDFAPPSGVFAPTWTALYVLMGVASWRVWQRRREGIERGDRRLARLAGAALVVYAVQLALNGAWPLLFFGLRSPAAGLLDLAALFPLVLVTAWLFYRVSRWAGLLLAPYAAWTGFATVLNAAFWHLNR